MKPGCVVFSDGLGCFDAVTDAGCVHIPGLVGSLKPKDLPEFKWINTVLCNLKTTLSGAFHALTWRTYVQTYLVALAYRFNWRFDLGALEAVLCATGFSIRWLMRAAIAAQASKAAKAFFFALFGLGSILLMWLGDLQTRVPRLLAAENRTASVQRWGFQYGPGVAIDVAG